jgi:hypothetical protein
LGRQFLFNELGFVPDTRLAESLSLGPIPGRAWFVSSSDPSSPETTGAPRRIRSLSEVTADEVTRQIDAMVAEDEWRELDDLDELELLERLRRVTLGFGFGGEDEMVWALTDVARDALRPLAVALVESSAAAHWWDPVDRANQRHIQWNDEPFPGGIEVAEAIHECSAHERTENEAGLARGVPTVPAGTRIGAHWWSAPSFTTLTSTTPSVSDIPALGLLSFVDVGRPWGETQATIWSLEISASARVLEIVKPSDWQRLVEEHPRDVTGTHNGEWRYWGGETGPWRLPDWESAARHYDGVHVTIGGYLATNGLALSAADGFTVLAGWAPGETLWLGDVATRREPIGTWSGNNRASQGWEDIRDGLN